MTPWLVLGGFLVFLGVSAWLYGRVTRHGPDPEWSARQDDGRRQIRRSTTGV
jgi:hypothetical protein